ncbi:MAG: DUF4886 domain-containing protein [Burkholderiales bacterium]
MKLKHPIASLWTAVSLALFSSAALSQTLPAPVVKKSPVDNPQRVLFVGSSIMYYAGALQTHTHRLAAADTPPLNLRPGYTSVHITTGALHHYPIEHYLKPGNLDKKEPFQVVVLGGNFRDGLTDAGRAKYRQTVIEFDALIKKHGGRTALYWLPPHGQPGSAVTPGELARRLQEMTLSVGNEVGALIIPVGLAFQEAYRQRPGIKLQMGYDDYHPTIAGQYLASSVVYASLYDRSPVGNPYDYFGAIDKDTKEFVQKIAYETVRKFFGR